MLRSRPKRVDFTESGIYVFESKHGPNFSMEADEWNFDKLCFVQQGKGELVTKSKSLPISGSDIVHLPASVSHRFVDDPSAPMTLVMVCFYRDVLAVLPSVGKAVSEFNNTFPSMTAFNSNNTHRRPAIMYGLRRMVFEQTTARSGSEAIIWGILTQLLVMLTRSALEYESRTAFSSKDLRFAQTLDFLEERFTDPLQIKDLATMAGLSYRRYTTLFKNHKGETVNAYINRLRLTFAQKRLLETDNVLFAALESGFGDLSHFYRAFKKARGKTPMKYMTDNSVTTLINPV
jgi:AraC-like DNA-binding protein